MDRVRAFLATENAHQQALRAVGGLLLGVGALVLFFRRASGEFANLWGDGALFAVLLVPCVFLYGCGLIAARGRDEARPWEAAYLVFGIILIPGVLLQFNEWVGITTDAPLNVAWVFLVTAIAGCAAALLAGVRVALFLAGLALIVSWLALWDELLANGVFEDRDLLRWLFLAIGALLAGAAVALRLTRAGRDGTRWNELITAGGVAVVAGAGGYALVQYYFESIFQGLSDQAPEPTGSWFWDTVMLVVSLALIWWSGREGSRGPAYVGTVGLGLFVTSVGLDIDDASPAGKIVGGPLIVLLLAAAALIASFADRLGVWPGRGTPEPPPPPTPHAPPPPQGQT